jgi:hypothetical protein
VALAKARECRLRGEWVQGVTQPSVRLPRRWQGEPVLPLDCARQTGPMLFHLAPHRPALATAHCPGHAPRGLRLPRPAHGPASGIMGQGIHAIYAGTPRRSRIRSHAGQRPRHGAHFWRVLAGKKRAPASHCKLRRRICGALADQLSPCPLWPPVPARKSAHKKARPRGRALSLVPLAAPCGPCPPPVRPPGRAPRCRGAR